MELPEINTQPISLMLAIKLGAIFGFSVGLVGVPYLFFSESYSGEIAATAVFLVLAPLANGMIGALYGLVGYPAYLFLWRRKRFGFDAVVMHKR